jgi:hypothetical protein
MLVMRFGQRVDSWPHYSSERLGEGVIDLIIKEPVETGSFFWNQVRTTRITSLQISGDSFTDAPQRSGPPLCLEL